LEFDPEKPIAKLLRFVDDKTIVAFCDGSVRFVKKIPDKSWALLIQKNDGYPAPVLDE
jgi:prepilin-type processing-associated H-X9-DG protein